jgi:general secretion pathway protein I
MRRRGFTLLEVLVATAIMAIAVTTAVTALRTSLRNADRQMELDRVGAVAQRKMDELLAERLNPHCQGFGGVFPPAYTGGIEAGWTAMVTPYETATMPPGPGSPALERIQLEVWWKTMTGRKTMRLEAYRRTVLTDVDVEWMQAHAGETSGGGTQ